MLRNRIGFAIWAVLVVLYFIGTRSFLSAVFLLGTITVLLFSYVSVAKSKQGLNIELFDPEQVRTNNKKSLKIALQNTSAYPLFSIKGTVVCENQETKAVEEMSFQTSLKAYMKEEISVKMPSEDDGQVVVTIKDVVVKDMIGIFAYAPEVGVSATVFVQPNVGEASETEEANQKAETEIKVEQKESIDVDKAAQTNKMTEQQGEQIDE